MSHNGRYIALAYCSSKVDTGNANMHGQKQVFATADGLFLKQSNYYELKNSSQN